MKNILDITWNNFEVRKVYKWTYFINNKLIKSFN